MNDQKNTEHKRHPKKYQGATIQAGDHEFLKALETQLNTPIPKVNEVEWDTFGFVVENQRVEQLGLYAKKLSSLPENIGNLSNLQTLILSSNQLVSLPETIGQLMNLQKVDLSGNKCVSLPETIGTMVIRQPTCFPSRELLLSH